MDEMRQRMIPPRLSIVTLCVRDMASMRAFYRALGWPEQSSASDEHAMFLTGGGVLALFPLEAMPREVDVELPVEPSGFRGVTLACNLDSREAVDRAFDSLRGIGAKILKEPQEVYWGGYSGYFADPEENYWEVAWNPFVSFDERGALIPGF
jgi:predicted lactoylglutathione lyase